MSYKKIVDWLTSIRGRANVKATVPDFGPVTMYLSGPRSRYPGSVNIVSTDSNEFTSSNEWIGAITPNGELKLSKEITDQKVFTEFLSVLASFPELVASMHGHLTLHCSFCGQRLSDPRSIAVGYGKTCAMNYHLPWGTPSLTHENAERFRGTTMYEYVSKLDMDFTDILPTSASAPKKTVEEIIDGGGEEAKELLSAMNTVKQDKSLVALLPYFVIHESTAPYIVREYNKSKHIPGYLEVTVKDILSHSTPLFRDVEQLKRLCDAYNPLWRIVVEDEDEAEEQALIESEIALYKRKYNWTIIKPIYDYAVRQKLSGGNIQDYLWGKTWFPPAPIL